MGRPGFTQDCGVRLLLMAVIEKHVSSHGFCRTWGCRPIGPSPACALPAVPRFVRLEFVSGCHWKLHETPAVGDQLHLVLSKNSTEATTGKGCIALRDSPRETLANLSITGHLRCFSDQPVADIVQCGEPAL